MKKKKHTNYLYMIDVDVKVTLYNNKLLRTNKYLKMKNFLLEISLKSRLIFFKKKKKKQPEKLHFARSAQAQASRIDRQC